MAYIPIIGLEIHAELKTKSKMFCSCKNGMGEETQPNINICPICTGQPGTLPVPNKTALEYVIRAGLALNCDIAKLTKFDRKNYFYPDLPKGYQISQYDQPLCENGYIVLPTGNKIQITRIHIEEDTGKLNHEINPKYTFVDLNRSSLPLMELVTEPDIRTAEEAKLFCQELQKVFRYLEITDANMEKGQMRCEANISVLPDNVEQIMENFGTKVEVKNLNSFKAVERAILYEVDRQTRALENGEPILQETRGWDEGKQMTYAQRTKEGAADYRYFPEPDILPIEIEHEKEDANLLSVPHIKRTIPELPQQKLSRFLEEYSMDNDDATLIIEEKAFADYMEAMLSELEEWIHSHDQKENKKTWETEKTKLVKMATGWFLSKLVKLLKEKEVTIENNKVTPENFAELIALLHLKRINSTAGQTVLEEMFTTGGDPEEIIKLKNLMQLDDDDQLSTIIDKVITDFPTQVQEYKSGKENVIQFLLGQVMKESKGKANPQSTIKMLKTKLNN